MDALLDQLGQLILQALPTFILLILLHLYLKWMFYRPLDKVLQERFAATEGARQAAEESIRKADQKAVEDDEALQAARAELFREQEVARKRLSADQAARIAEARRESDDTVRSAKAEIDQQVQQAKKGLEAETEMLAGEIVEALLERKAS
jgi:F-type H+-transporting ATPase subunit b